MDELINVDGAYDGDDSFTVVNQPHMRDLRPPLTVSGSGESPLFIIYCYLYHLIYECVCHCGLVGNMFTQKHRGHEFVHRYSYMVAWMTSKTGESSALLSPSSGRLKNLMDVHKGYPLASIFQLGDSIGDVALDIKQIKLIWFLQ